MATIPLIQQMEKELSLSKEECRSLIESGKVFVNGKPVLNSGSLIEKGSSISVLEGRKYVSRGAYKLLHAITHFKVTIEGKNAADAGSSTGGFTQVLLEMGATEVYAIDVGYGELDYKLRVDPRVKLFERTNVKNLHTLPEPVDIVTADLSFISLTRVIPNFYAWLNVRGRALLLIKPQFEVEREEVEEGGIIKNPLLHEKAINKIRSASEAAGFEVEGVTPSPIKGMKGNQEFIISLLK